MSEFSLEGPEHVNPAEKMHAAELEDLRALAEMLGLKILRKRKVNGVTAIVVDDGRGEEVYIGFPGGRMGNNGKLSRSPATTGSLYEPRIKTVPYGNGIWRRCIDV
jgi:hypothetical protein